VASINAPLAASGFVGAVTSLIVGSADKIIPSGDAKSLIAIASGMLAAIISFEVMSWFLLIRLKLTQRSLQRIIPQFETIQGQLNDAAIRQMAIMKNHNASQAAINTIEKEISDLSVSMAKAVLKIQQKSLGLLHDLDS
jgi:hypothetical protein